MDMNEIKEIFFQECEEQLAELESGLLKLNDGDRDPETVNAVFRAVHSIKGGAGAFGLDDLVSFAHVFETTLDCVRSNKLEPTQDVLKVMLKSADTAEWVSRPTEMKSGLRGSVSASARMVSSRTPPLTSVSIEPGTRASACERRWPSMLSIMMRSALASTASRTWSRVRHSTSMGGQGV